jgi:hypothetical protein
MQDKPLTILNKLGKSDVIIKDVLSYLKEVNQNQFNVLAYNIG